MSARQKPLFRPSLENELGFVGGIKTDHIVSRRADIIREDEIGGPVYTLFEGWAIRYHRPPNGACQIIDIVLPGDPLGLAPAVLGRVKHSVQAITPATLCVLQDRRFSELFAGHAAPALNILRTRVENEQRIDIRPSLLGRSTAERRIGHLMLENFDRLRERGMAHGVRSVPFYWSAAISRTLASRGCMSPRLSRCSAQADLPKFRMARLLSSIGRS